MIRYLGIDRLTEDERVELKSSIDSAQAGMADSLQGFQHEPEKRAGWLWILSVALTSPGLPRYGVYVSSGADKSGVH